MITTSTKHRQSTTEKSIRDDLIVGHLGYVKHILKRLLAQLPPRVDAENLESAGVVGLIEAANQFDPGRDVEFRTFAYQRIRGAILDELRRNCPLSQQMLQRISFIRQVREQLDSSATVEQLADISGLPVEQVAECLAAARLTRPESWNESVHGESFRNPETVDISEQQEMRQVLADGIETLPDTMRIAISLHYMEGLKLREVGNILGLSESRVCRIVNTARDRLKDYARQRDCGAA
jgi:RNA polymerase sigma factor for flagellar operon FliA